jgi:Family of unknown function (DUF5677)
MSDHAQFFRDLEIYIKAARRELHVRFDSWQFDPNQSEVHEVVGALMARQVSIATQFAMNPGIWNGHIAPVLLRGMVDVYITFAWTLKDPLDRSRKFILHGLGQEKLHLEYLKSHFESDENSAEEHPVVQAITAWIDSQRFTFLTEVNIGSWSGISTREMAQDAGCMDIYRHAYTPFSSAAHSMWNHVAKYNLQLCENPLHRYHQVPIDAVLPIDPDYLYRAAKYLDKTFNAFDESFSLNIDVLSSFSILTNILDKLQESDNEELDNVSEDSA